MNLDAWEVFFRDLRINPKDSAIVRRLLELRERAIAKGMKLLSQDEINEIVREARRPNE